MKTFKEIRERLKYKIREILIEDPAFNNFDLNRLAVRIGHSSVSVSILSKDYKKEEFGSEIALRVKPDFEISIASTKIDPNKDDYKFYHIMMVGSFSKNWNEGLEDAVKAAIKETEELVKKSYK